MSNKRQRMGERNGRAKLTNAQVEEMRRLREEEIILPGRARFWTRARLARRFGVTPQAVGLIINYLRRTDIPDER